MHVFEPFKNISGVLLKSVIYKNRRIVGCGSLYYENGLSNIGMFVMDENGVLL